MDSNHEATAPLRPSEPTPVPAWTTTPPKPEPGSPPRRAARRPVPWSPLWPWAVVVAASLAVVHPFLAAPPLSHDHPVHIFKAWHFWTEMLGRGRLRGWSHFWGFGFPSGELTPFGADAWVAVWRVLTLAQLPWLRTYGVAFAAVLTFATMAMFVFTRRFFGPAAGVLAALLMLLDPGEWAEGGWMWHTTFGVWPVTLAMSFVLLSLVKLCDVLWRERVGDIVLAGLLMAAALLVHQLPLVVYAIVVPLLVLHRWLSGPAAASGQAGQARTAEPGATEGPSERRPDAAGRVHPVLRVALACALGGGLAAFYLVPMLARNDLTQDLGVLGVSRDALGQQIAGCNLFGRMWPPLFVLGGVGAALAWRSERGAGLLLPMAALAFVLLATNSLIIDVHVERLVPGLIKIEARRALLVARSMWIALAAHAVVTLFHLAVPARAPGAPRGRRRWVALLVLLVLVSPLAWPVAREIGRTQIVKTVQTPDSTAFWSDLSSLLAWSAQLPRKSGEVHRVAYALPMHDHLSTLAPVFDGTWIYKVGYTPAQQFNRFPMSDEPALLEELGIEYVVSDHDYVGAGNPDFTLDRTFGALRVYRFARHRPTPWSMVGPGHAELIRLDPERLRIRVNGTHGGGAPSRLKLDVAAHPRWRATLDGHELPISMVAAHDAEYPFLMEVPVHDGVLELRYVLRAADWLGLVITWLALFGLGGLACVRAGGPVRDGRERAWRRAWFVGVRRAAAVAAGWTRARVAGRMRGGLALGALLVALGLGAWARLGNPLAPPLQPRSMFGLPGSGTSGVRAGSVSLELGGAACLRDGHAAWQCGAAGRVEGMVRSGLYGAHVCMAAPTDKPLVVTAEGPVPRFVTGRYDPGEGEGRIRVEVGGREVGNLATRDQSQGLQFFQFDTRADTGRVLPVRTTFEGAALHCFDVAPVP